MEKFKKALSLLPFIIGGCAGIYLTYLVDTVTLDSIFDRIFIFLFFTLCSTLLLFFVKKYIGLKFSLKLVACTAVLSLSFILLAGESLMPQKKQNAVSLEAVVSGNTGHGEEVWLAEVVSDGVNIPCHELNVIANEGWQYVSDSDDYVYYPKSGTDNKNKLTLEVSCENMMLVFACNSWSGKVFYTVEASSTKGNLELYSAPENAVKSMAVSLDLGAMNTPLKAVFCFLGAFVTLFFYVYLLLIILDKTLAKKQKNELSRGKLTDTALPFGVYLLFVSYLLELLEVRYSYSFGNTVLTLGFILLLLLIPYSSRILPALGKMNVGEILLLVLIAFIVAFQSFAQFILMDIEKSSVNFTDVLTLIIATVVVAVPILELTLFVDRHSAKRFIGGGNNEK